MFGDLGLPFDNFRINSSAKKLDLNSKALESWPEVEATLKALLSNCQTASCIEDVKLLIHETSELESALHERAQMLANGSHANLTNSKVKTEEINFRENVFAPAAPYFHDIYQALSATNFWKEAIQDLPPTFPARMENLLHIFHPDIPQITTHVQGIEDQIGFSLNLPKIKITYNALNISDFNKQLEHPNQVVREGAWRVLQEAYLVERERLHHLYSGLLDLRQQIAEKAGFSNYTEYAFRSRNRLDISPEDCLRFHEVVKRVVMPALRLVEAWRKQDLGIVELRPWDEKVTPGTSPALSLDADYFAKICKPLLAVFPGAQNMLAEMRENKLIDAEPRRHKANTNYMTPLAYSRRAFFFGNLNGGEDDVWIVNHELGGHCLHAFRSGKVEPFQCRNLENSLDATEAAAMSMELMGMENLDQIYSGSDLARAQRRQLERVLFSLAFIAKIDAFEHWAHTNPAHSVSERREKWLELERIYGQDSNWHGLEQYRDSRWQQKPHPFFEPLTYNVYGFAQAAALGQLQHYNGDRQQAVQKFLAALDLGGAQPLPVFYATLGVPFDFSATAIEPLINSVVEKIASLRSV